MEIFTQKEKEMICEIVWSHTFLDECQGVSNCYVYFPLDIFKWTKEVFFKQVNIYNMSKITSFAPTEKYVEKI